MKSILISLLLSIISIQVYAQRIVVKIERTTTYTTRRDATTFGRTQTSSETFSKYFFSVDGSEFEVIRKDGKNLGEYLSSNPEAYAEFQLFLKKAKMSRRLFWASIGVLGGVVAAYFIHRKTQDSQNTDILLYGGLGVVGGYQLTKYALQKTGEKNLKTAVEIYNLGLK